MISSYFRISSFNFCFSLDFRCPTSAQYSRLWVQSLLSNLSPHLPFCYSRSTLVLLFCESLRSFPLCSRDNCPSAVGFSKQLSLLSAITKPLCRHILCSLLPSRDQISQHPSPSFHFARFGAPRAFESSEREGLWEGSTPPFPRIGVRGEGGPEGSRG
jgi:hypothetical protein